MKKKVITKAKSIKDVCNELLQFSFDEPIDAKLVCSKRMFDLKAKGLKYVYHVQSRTYKVSNTKKNIKLLESLASK